MAKRLHWRILGYVRDTGENVDVVVHAPSRDGAGAWCESQGIIADEIQPTRRSPSLDATIQQPRTSRRSGHGLFEVQVVDREDGTERWVEVEAPSNEDARSQVAATGELVGHARLIRMIARDERSNPPWNSDDCSWSMAGVSVPILISAIANILIGLLWASTCIGIVIAVPL